VRIIGGNILYPLVTKKECGKFELGKAEESMKNRVQDMVIVIAQIQIEEQRE